MGDYDAGNQAQLMSQALRKIAGSLNRSRTAVIVVNQLCEKNLTEVPDPSLDRIGPCSGCSGAG
jgi:RecA/RadA recombinase